MTNNTEPTIHNLFQGLQSQMEAQLKSNRSFIPHAPSKGEALENVWIEWLRDYLPNRYSVDKALVIDSEGTFSEQIDLVIYDQQYTPFIFTQNGMKFIPAEGVYAVFEIKPDLNGSAQSKGRSVSYIEYASEKIASVRRLKRTSTFIVDRGAQRNPRPLTKIIGGILTNVNTYKKNATIESHLSATAGLGSLDLGCCVEFGSFAIDYTTKEDESITDFHQRIQTYYQSRTLSTVNYAPKEKALISFFLQLSRYLQQSIGTVAAIDFQAYANQLQLAIDSEL